MAVVETIGTVDVDEVSAVGKSVAADEMFSFSTRMCDAEADGDCLKQRSNTQDHDELASSK